MEFFHTSSFSAIRKQSGFSLIELLIVVVIISTLFGGLTLLFNPLQQITKAQNANRVRDLRQIQLGLDAYFHDTGCYPTSISFGTSWVVNATTYLTKVPEDPTCQQNGTHCYIYQTDITSSCPQWNVLYSQEDTPVPPDATCNLTGRQCAPPNMPQVGVNYCLVSGTVDCGYITSNSLPVSPPSGGSSPTATPTIAPTPTPGNELCGTGNYHACTAIGSNGCNSLGWQQESQCKALGGNMDCYCDTLCRVNGVNQCH